MRTIPSIHRKAGLRNWLAGATLLGVTCVAGAADDTALFSTSFPPNVLLMVDNSGSMSEIMTHPAFDGSLTPTCSVVPSSGSGNILDDNGEPVRYSCGNNCRLEFGASDVSDEVATPTSADHSDSFYIERTFCGETRRIYFDGNMQAVGNRMRWLKDYTDWYFSIDTDNDSLTYGPGAQTADEIVAEVDDEINGRRYIDGVYFPLYQRSRMTAAREIARDVIYQTNSDCPAFAGDCGVYQDNVRFGLATFRSGSHGGFVSVPIDAYSANRTALNAGITSLDPSGNTPLGETLFQLYTYFMSRSATATNRPLGQNLSTRFPAYYYNASGGYTTSAYLADPVSQSCQKNFIIMLTDGAPTADDFATSGAPTGSSFGSFGSLVGDYNPDAPGDPDIGSDATPEVGSPPWEISSGAGYLDDIAKYMQDVDARPDLTGFQRVDTYAIGFATSGVANSLLAKTAAAGNGLYAASADADDLTVALVAAIDDIIVKAQAFTAATVPASRATDGNNFFASYFVPDNTRAYWEGHLKLFEYNAAGEVLDKPVPPATAGACALEDPLAPAQCKVGRLKVELPGYWDAADEIPSAAESGGGIRKLLMSDYTSAPPSTLPATPATFDTTNVTAALLGITETGGLLTTLISQFSVVGSITGILTAENLADAIARYVRGCAFSSSSTCTDRGDGKKLWDIFHSNPVVVGPPNSGNRELAYREFVSKYAHRKRVIYAGSNGGFVHGFNTGVWDTTLDPDNYNRGTGAEEFGFMAYPARKKIRALPTSSVPKLITMDGSPQSADVWLYPTGTSVAGDATTWNEWRTVLIGGMRQGGRVVYALDVSNPPDPSNPTGVTGGPAYPGYLWEFPCESTDAQCTGGTTLPGSRAYADYMGETWSDPVITRVKVRIDCTDTTTTTCPRYDRWVAIFGAGYDENGDPNKVHSVTPSATQYDSSDTTTTSREGRALFMVDVKSGKLLGMKRYDNSSSLGNPEMRFAFTATPAVFDLNFDGYADAVYAADLGGNVWKWLITDAVLDPINGTGDLQHNSTNDMWPFYKIFTAGNCTSATLTPAGPCAVPHYRTFYFPPTGALVNGTLWLGLGSGERNDLPYVGTMPAEKNRFYVFQDQDPFERETTAISTGSRFTDAGTSTDFVDVTSLSGACNPPPPPAVGFYLEAAQGEKFVTDSTIFFGVVLTSSYVPTVSADPCEVGGESYLYGFKLFCGEGIFQPPTPGDPMQRFISIGGGLPNRPRVSVGPVTDGGGGGGCADMVVVITSEGGAYTDCPGGRPDSGIHTKAWRDD
jgi:type IV pilus assembly protein PilY1